MTAMSATREGPTVTGSSSAGLTVDVQYACARAGLPDRRHIRRWVKATLAGTRSPVELTVRIVDEPEGAELNRRWRRRAGSTNVLSFPAARLGRVAPEPLGDIVICAPVVLREAREQGKKPEAHWAHMVVHGTLHLLGFDHVRAAEARTMEAFEAQVLEGLGFPNPYA